MTTAVRHCIKRLVDSGLVNSLNEQSATLALREMEAMVIGQVQVRELGLRNAKRHTEKTKNQISNTLKTNFDLERVNNKLNKRI